MSSSESIKTKVRRYTKNLEDGDEPKRALKRLFELDASPKIFHDAETRNHLRKYLDDPQIGKYAERLKNKLRDQKKVLKAEKEQRKRDRAVDEEEDVKEEIPLKQPKVEQLSSDQLFSLAISGTQTKETKEPKAPVDYSKYKVSKKKDIIVKQEVKEEVFDPEYVHPGSSSSSSTSTLTVPDKKYDLPSSSSSSARHSITSEVSRNFISSMSSVPSSSAPRGRPIAAKVITDENMFKPRKERQKVFAGRKKKNIGDVPSLLQMCQDVLASNVNHIGYVGWAPYHLLKGSLTRCSDDQLRRILDMNPNLAADADELFHNRVRLEFPKYADQEKGDDWSWRELYDRLVTKKQSKDKAKLEKLTSRIGKSLASHDTGRRTMVIDVAHTNVKRRTAVTQMKIPTPRMTVTPSASELSQARKNIHTQGRASLNALQAPVRAAIHTSSRPSAPKKTTAPMMARIKKMLRR